MIRSLARVATSTFRTSAILVKFLTLRAVDAFCMLFNVMAVCTVIRIPALCYSTRRKLLHETSSNARRFPRWIDLWHFLGIFQVGVFIVDLPFVLMSLPLVLFFWRAVLLLREHGRVKFEREGAQYNYINAWGYTGWRLRKLVWKHFCLLCTDFFFIPFSISLTLSWRSSRFLRLIQEQYRSDDELTWKKTIVKEFLILCNEIICFPIITCFLLSWRSRRVRTKIMQSTRTRDSDAHMSDLQVLWSLTQTDTLGDAFFCEWYIVISETFNFSLDIITLPILTFLLLSWRSRLTWQILKPWYVNNLAVNPPGTLPFNNEQETRAKIWGQFFNVVVDLFYIPPMIIVSFSWRVVAFCRSMVALYSQECIPSRRSHQELLLDIKFQIVREKVIHHFLGILTDVICIFAFSVIFMLSVVFPWRLYIVIASLWREFRNKTVTEKSVKSCIFDEFLLVIRDIPTFVAGLMILLTVWRFPFLLSDFLRIRNNDSTVSKSHLVTSCIFRQLILLLVDILVAPFLIVTLISIWRLKPFMKEVRDSRTPLEAAHWRWFIVLSRDGNIVRKAAVIHSMSSIFIDLPCLGLFLLNIAFPLRLPAIVSSLFLLATTGANVAMATFLCLPLVLTMASPPCMAVHTPKVPAVPNSELGMSTTSPILI